MSPPSTILPLGVLWVVGSLEIELQSPVLLVDHLHHTRHPPSGIDIKWVKRCTFYLSVCVTTVESLDLFSNQKLSYCLIIVVSGGSHERRLLNDLSLNYNKLERPVAEESEALVTKFGLALQQILDVVKHPHNVCCLSADLKPKYHRMRRIRSSLQTSGWTG